MEDFDNHEDPEVVFGVCPFGCNADEDDDNQVEFQENLIFKAVRTATECYITDVELRYICNCCYTSFSIDDREALELSSVDELRERLCIKNSKITLDGQQLKPMGLIVDSCDSVEADESVN